MFERLADIDWSALRHMYGSGEDLPPLIRDLASPDEWMRDHARWQLAEYLYHQNSVTAATTVTIPFMIELLTGEGSQDKEQILELLSIFIDEFFGARSLEGTKDAGLLASGPHWESILRALRSGITTYLALLAHPNPKTRLAATFVLGLFINERPDLKPSLWQMLGEEHDPRVAAGLLLCIGTGATIHEVSLDPYLSIINSHAPAAIQLVAAIEGICQDKGCNASMVRQLTSVASDDTNRTLIALYLSWWGSWLDRRMDRACSLCAVELSPSYVRNADVFILGAAGLEDVQADIALYKLTLNLSQRLRQRDTPQLASETDDMLGVDDRSLILGTVATIGWQAQHPRLLRVVNSLLACLFARYSRDLRPSPQAVTTTQRTVLAAIARCGLWESDWWMPDLAKVLRSYSLPDSQRQLQKFIASE